MWFMTGFFAVAGSALRSAAIGVGRLGMALGEYELRKIIARKRAGEMLKNFRVDISSNIPDTSRWLGDVGRQVPYATAVALTRTAKRLSEMYAKEIDTVFHQPISFTRRGFGFAPANKSTLTSKVFIKDRQGKYLLPHIVGGRRGQKAFEKRLSTETGVDDYWAPGQGVKLTAAGNLSLSQIKKIADGLRKSGQYGEVFVGVPRGHPGAPFGVWGRPKATGRRVRGGIKPLLIRIPAPHYSRRFDFYGFAEKHAGRIFNEEFTRAWREAQRKVKPISPRMEHMWSNHR